MGTVTIEDVFCAIGIVVALWCLLFVWRHGGGK